MEYNRDGLSEYSQDFLIFMKNFRTHSKMKRLFSKEKVKKVHFHEIFFKICVQFASEFHNTKNFSLKLLMNQIIVTSKKKKEENNFMLNQD
ncbi:hypothetical protein BpHYR1_001374 [Brachionus plicatilis]|uniref:Uncharacterized protein n=1 Tax=Brachionus plicatilis TaxID=10195 RepID=A0A3M7PDK3_BRAPC|nr:hypothetical protein BpHYR1_001374 [Brachionus plicatilis]